MGEQLVDSGPKREVQRRGTPAARDAVRPDPGRSGLLTPGNLLSLQRFAGNRAVCGLVKQGSSPTAAPTPVQRLSFKGTKWEDATSAKVSSGGRVGVLFLDDGNGPVVIKSGEPFTIESEVAASMLGRATAGQSGGWTSGTPQARSVGDTESKRIHTKASELLQPVLTGGTQAEKDRAERLIRPLESNDGVSVYGFVKGEEFHTLMSTKKQTGRKGFLGLKRGVREGTIADRFMNDPGLVTMLGRASAADIFLGNSDRLIGKINLENVLVNMEAKEIKLIDNVEAGDAAVLRDMPKFNTTGFDGFKRWSGDTVRQQVQAGQYDAVTDFFLKALRDFFQQGIARKQDIKTLQKTLDKRRTQIAQWFTAGLVQGTSDIRQGLLDGAITITADIDPSKREQVVANLLARGYFIEGMARDAAWKEGAELAHLLVGNIVMPKLPQVPKVGV